MFAMLAVLVLCLAAGICLFTLGWNNAGARDLGTALLAGAVFAGVAFLAQKSFEDRDYFDSLAMAGDMKGFDDLGHNLENAPLSDRSMVGALLDGAQMEGANLAYSDLSSAHLRGAHLRGATLFHTAFDEADLREADLREANLRGATFFKSWFLATTRFARAKADLNTCWPIELVPESEWARLDQPEATEEGKTLLARLKAARLEPSGVDSDLHPMKQTIGHVCVEDDMHVAAGQPKPVAHPFRIRVCRNGTLVRVQRLANESDHPRTCERP